MGPKQPTPSASIFGCARKKSMHLPSVSLGVVVGKRACAFRSSGPVPTAHTNLVPPASIAPYKDISEPIMPRLADLKTRKARKSGLFHALCRRQRAGERGKERAEWQH